MSAGEDDTRIYGGIEMLMREWWWDEMENMMLYSMKARALFELGRRVVVGGDVRVKNFVIDSAKELAGGKPFEVKKVILKCLSLGKSNKYISMLVHMLRNEREVGEEMKKEGKGL